MAHPVVRARDLWWSGLMVGAGCLTTGALCAASAASEPGLVLLFLLGGGGMLLTGLSLLRAATATGASSADPLETHADLREALSVLETRQRQLEHLIQAHLRGPSDDDAPTAVSIEAINYRTATVRRAPSETGAQGLPCAVGPMTLHLHTETTDEVALPAVLEADDGDRLRLRLLDPRQVEEDVPPALREVMEQRGASRARPVAHAPLFAEVALSAGTPRILAEVIDLSVTGIRLRLPLRATPVTERLWLWLRLPGESAPHTLQAHIRWRQAEGGHLLLGGAFERSPASSTRPDALHAAIAAWVAARLTDVPLAAAEDAEAAAK